MPAYLPLTPLKGKHNQIHPWWERDRKTGAISPIPLGELSERYSRGEEELKPWPHYYDKHSGGYLPVEDPSLLRKGSVGSMRMLDPRVGMTAEKFNALSPEDKSIMWSRHGRYPADQANWQGYAPAPIVDESDFYSVPLGLSSLRPQDPMTGEKSNFLFDAIGGVDKAVGDVIGLGEPFSKRFVRQAALPLLDFYEDKFEAPIRDATLGQFGEAGMNTLGIGTPSENRAWRTEMRDNPTLTQAIAGDPFSLMTGPTMLFKSGRLLNRARGLSRVLGSSVDDTAKFMKLHAPPPKPLANPGSPGLGQRAMNLFRSSGTPMDPGRRRILAGGLGLTLGGLIKGGGRRIGDIPNLSPREAMSTMQRRWHGGGRVRLVGPPSFVGEDLRLANESLTGRGRGLTLDPQLQVEHHLDSRGIHPEYGDVLPPPVNPLRLGQGHAPLTEEKIQQVLEGAKNEEERRLVKEYLETNRIPHHERRVREHEATLRDLLLGKKRGPASMHEQQRLESLGDEHFQNLTHREQLKEVFLDRRDAKQRLSVVRQNLEDVMRGKTPSIEGKETRWFHGSEIQAPLAEFGDDLERSVSAMGTDLVNPNSSVFSQPVLDNLNAIRMKHNEEAFDLVQKYKRSGDDPFELGLELRQLKNNHGTTLVDSIVDDAVSLMEKRVRALDPEKYGSGLHPHNQTQYENLQELRFNLEQTFQPYDNPARMGTFDARGVPKQYSVTPPPAPAPAGSFEAVEPPLIRYIKKRRRVK